MILDIDTDAALPPFEQLRGQISTMIVTGTLRDGARLPPIRQLAADLGLAGGTVARAYRELEQAGLVATRGRHGTFVTVPAVAAEPEAALEAAARSYAVRVRQLGVDRERAVRAARVALEQLGRSGA